MRRRPSPRRRRREDGDQGVLSDRDFRLHRSGAISLLRRGAPASGKNYLIEVVISLLPPESVIVCSSTSDKALAYYGGDDPGALKHKLVYIPEASSLLTGKGVEREFAGMLRTLISEKRIVYLTGVRDDRPPETITIVKNGPIACMVTSARDNIEDEMLTRLLFADSDESLSQSSKIMSSALEAVTGALPPASLPEIELFRDFQRWLEFGAPYDVVIPYAQEIRAAFGPAPKDIRIRRDLGGLIAAIFSSAIMHRAQRQTDAEGRVVATLDDYRYAYEAVASGLATVYQPLGSPSVIALVRVLEGMIGAERTRLDDEIAKFKAAKPAEPLPRRRRGGHARAVGAALGIASRDAVTDRVARALAVGAIEIVNPEAARAVPRRFRVKIGSAALASRRDLVFPSPEAVEAMMKDPFEWCHAMSIIANEEDRATDPAAGAATSAAAGGVIYDPNNEEVF